MAASRASCDAPGGRLMAARTATAEQKDRVADRQATAASRGDKRRRGIFQALHDCVIAQGYAKTTLADIARAAGMSPSHLLYYFPGRDAILEQTFAARSP